MAGNGSLPYGLVRLNQEMNRSSLRELVLRAGPQNVRLERRRADMTCIGSLLVQYLPM
jgi:hypothetical protein